MPTLAASYSAFANAVYSTARHSSRHVLKPRKYSTLPLHTDYHENPLIQNQPGTSETSQLTSRPEKDLRETRLEQLKYVLSAKSPSPARVWTHYTSLMNVTGYDNLPLSIHQSVLRACTPSAQQMRETRTQQIHAREAPPVNHIHEYRFQTIIRHMRAAGVAPDLEDYHFILEQFAAVGHNYGAMHVYREIVRTGLNPTSKTFGLVLQTIAHRLTMPAKKENLERRSKLNREMLSDLIQDMQKSGTGFTAVNVGLVLRILKETMDMPTLEIFMKAGYGIDLNNPDHPPVVEASLKSDLTFGERGMFANPNPQPLTLGTLNTVLDILGKLDNVSKMIQTFEVLTQPLPASSQAYSSFDDDDDFMGSGVGNGQPSQAAWKPPHVVPNITTYCILLRHIGRLGHHTLARHYINEVMHLDKFRDWGMRKRIFTLNSLDKVSSPRISINRGIFTPAIGDSNRNKDLGLMRWILTKLPKIIKRKKENIEWYTSTRTRMAAKEREERVRLATLARESAPAQVIPATSKPAIEEEGIRADDGTTEPAVDTPFTRDGESVDLRNRKAPEPELFDLDLTSEEPVKPDPPKYLDINLHIRILQRDLDELTQLQKYIEWVLGRNTQRVKEHLGRRVWDGKDIYVGTAGGRVTIEKSEWPQMANFQARPAGDYIPTSTLEHRRNRAKKLPTLSSQARDPRFDKYFNRTTSKQASAPPQQGVFSELLKFSKDKSS